jgi:hypothetical protein
VFFFLSGRRGSFPISSLKESSNSPWKKKKERERERGFERFSEFGQPVKTGQKWNTCQVWAAWKTLIVGDLELPNLEL